MRQPWGAHGQTTHDKQPAAIARHFHRHRDLVTQIPETVSAMSGRAPASGRCRLLTARRTSCRPRSSDGLGSAQWVRSNRAKWFAFSGATVINTERKLSLPVFPLENVRITKHLLHREMYRICWTHRCLSAQIAEVAVFNSSSLIIRRQRSASVRFVEYTVCCACIIIARQHTDARYWYSKSVRLSVCPLRSGTYYVKMA